MSRAGLAIAVLGATLCLSGASAQRISLQDSFRIGSGASVLCSAQALGADPALENMFDRGYAVACRDAAAPVGRLYALRLRGEDPAARLASIRASQAECETPQQEQIEGVGAVEVAACRLTAAGVSYRVYTKRQGNSLFVAEGLGGYDSALRLGLRSLIADRAVDGEVSVATTGAGDPAAFARVQAGSLDPQRALNEAYRRNNAGSYAEAAEFFGTLLTADESTTKPGEAIVNQALQQSNLGRYREADIQLARAAAFASRDPVIARMLRNYRAIHLMNQDRPQRALAALDRPLPSGAGFGPASPVSPRIDAQTAARLNSESPVGRQLGAAVTNLQPEEKAQILDGQSQHIRGIIHRIEGRPDEAARALEGALADLVAVRSGRVISTLWMRAQIYSELATISESRRAVAEAEGHHQAAVALLEVEHPGSSALLSAQGRLAGFYARTERVAQARVLFRQIVETNVQVGNSSPTLRRTLAPYFALLAADAGPEAVADLFMASQLLVRPGVAQTQAVLARELSGGSGEAARLFRQSVTLTRDIERSRIEAARLAALEAPGEVDIARLAALNASVVEMEHDQVGTQARLAAYPRYRVVSGGAMTLAELQQMLREGEAYYKMTIVGTDAYALFATATQARAYRIEASPIELERQVDALRATIAVVEKGEVVTYPFDVETAHRLYQALFQPIAGEVSQARHLIFEPDGAMLRLPPNLLVTEQSGIDAHLAKAADPANDGFDFTDVIWLGRDRDISTAVSARAFRDVRQAARSGAARDYIGFGQNAPADGFLRPASGTRAAAPGSDCAFSLGAWSRPISSEELYTASRALTPQGASRAQIVTGEAFSDTAIMARDDLSEYRIMHFATHGLVTAPRPECPARPALMTSFGEGESDGLLTFREIFDLRIDADLVILSACDTAGQAGLAATREAGITSGGDFALDGLVRAFVGAGGRLVVASHWPVPDDYDATKRLISGLFTAPAGTSTAAALRMAEQALMREPATSHPYYWSGFAIIGDGAAPVIPAGTNLR